MLVKSGPTEYYLGNDIRYEDQEKLWTMGYTTYSKEAVHRIEEARDPLRKEHTTLPVEREGPELDRCSLLGEADHMLYQILIGMAQRLNAIGP